MATPRSIAPLSRLSWAVALPILLGSVALVPAAHAQAPDAAAQLASLRWLEGRWLGSGGRYAAFYEEYRFVNDSTIEQREIADSTFARIDSRSHITLRDGRIVKLNEAGERTAEIRVAADTAVFSAGERSYRWIRTGQGEWVAELGSVTYRMKRIGR